MIFAQYTVGVKLTSLLLCLQFSVGIKVGIDVAAIFPLFLHSVESIDCLTVLFLLNSGESQWPPRLSSY
jgi:hypothetical protein